MAVYKQKDSKNWWYKFTWNGEPIRESTKQTNKRVAEQMEATHKASPARGEVGIREKEPVPTLRDFAEDQFLPFVRSISAAKPNTIRFYENSAANLKAYNLRLIGLRQRSSRHLSRIGRATRSRFRPSIVIWRHCGGCSISRRNGEGLREFCLGSIAAR